MIHRWRLVAGLISTFGLVLAMGGSGPILASAGNGNGNGNETKTTICHRTASHTNPYVKITVDNSAINAGGPNQGNHFIEHRGPIGPVAVGEWGDIIPPVADVEPGLNWTAEGQAIYDNICRVSNELWDSGITTTIFRSNGDPVGSPQPGVSVYDTASLTYDETTEIVPTGTVSYYFYNTINATGPSTSKVVVNLDSAGDVPRSSTTGPLGAGSYSFVAVYSGDSYYKTSTSAVEPLAVVKADPSISTTPNPASALVGATLNDSATLQAGFNPTGTITFTLYDPSNNTAHTEIVNVAGNGTYATSTGHNAGTAGTWHWTASYSGDANNRAVASLTADEPVVVTEGENVRVQPTITTTPIPTNTSVGATLKDTATLSGGNNPTGSITFTLYDPSGTAVHTEQVTVSGNGTYQTPTGHVAGSQGTWHWKAAYGGDANNLPASSNAADEPVVVGPTGGVLASTGQTSPVQGLAAGLMAAGLVAILVALARRRREA